MSQCHHWITGTMWFYWQSFIMAEAIGCQTQIKSDMEATEKGHERKVSITPSRICIIKHAPQKKTGTKNNTTI